MMSPRPMSPSNPSQLNCQQTSSSSKSEIACVSQFIKYKMKYSWNISEFDVFFPPAMVDSPDTQHSAPPFKELTSPSFVIGEGTLYESHWAVVATVSYIDTHWTLGLYVMLLKEKTRQERKTVDCLINILDKHDVCLESGHLNQTFDTQNSSWGWNGYKDLQTIYREDVFLGSDNTLRVLVDMTLYGGCHNKTRSQEDETGKELEIQKFRAKTVHNGNMINLLTSGTLSDAIIVCGSKEFLVHVNILSAQSEVFLKTFDTQMKEGISRRLEIHDSDPEAIGLLISYIYTGDVEEILANGEKFGKLSELIEVADMYLVHDLKELIFIHLTKSICPETAGKLAILSYLHSPSSKIKRDITKYCHDNWTTLCRVSSFLKYVVQTPEAFKEHLNDMTSGYSTTFSSFRGFQHSRIGRRINSAGWKLPFALKVVVGAYFLGLLGMSFVGTKKSS